MAENNKIISDKTEHLQDEIIALKLAIKKAKSELKEQRESHADIINKLSHDLKNPIGIIYSFIEMILENGENYDKEKLRKYLNVIKNSASFSIELLNNLAKYSNLLSEKITLTLERTNYTKLLKSVLRSFEKQAESKNITLIDNTGNKEVVLNIDANEMVIALNNIFSNAIRFSNQGSKISVELEDNKNTVVIGISDEGIGIAAKHHKDIFKEFFTVNTYDEAKQKCVGLGLSLCDKIVMHHGGNIAVKSKANKGTTFSIELPKL